MVSITFLSSDGTAKVIEAQAGLSLMEAAVAGGIDAIDAECGGNCYCGTCRVYIDPAWIAAVGTPQSYEIDLMDGVGEDAPGARLSCQIPVTEALDGMTVTTPANQR